MKELLCKEVSGVWDCEFVATGETDEEVKEKLMEHAAAEHPDVMGEMGEEQKEEMGQKMDGILANQ